MKTKISLTLGALALVTVLGTNVALAAANSNPNILPIGSTPYGQTYSQWADAWCQWAMSFPKEVNPMLDATGASAALGQSGPVWFLAGTMGGEVTRTVTIPAGKALFFPIYQALWINIPLLGDNPWDSTQEAFARQALVDWYLSQYGPGDFTCQIDGQIVKQIISYRCPTGFGEEFMVTLPENDAWGLVGLPTVDGGIFQPGTYGPSVQDGYYLMVAPLSAGQHTIHFTVRDFLDVTYDLIVLKPVAVRPATVEMSVE